MAYRALPLKDTVEYEEDFGLNMMIHREYVNRRQRNRLNFDVMPLSYSDTELQRGKQHLARRMNQERERSSLATDQDVKYETAIDPDSNEIKSARYLLNDARMQYCQRFAEAFPNDQFHALMEASAILHGTEEPDLREAYFSMFLNLDKNSLDNAMEGIRSMAVDHADVEKELRQLQWAAVDDENDEDALVVDEDEEHGEAGTSIPKEFMEFAPLMKSYLAHSRGEAPIASRDLTHIALQGFAYERHRWRALIDKLSSEQFSLNDVELADARNLNEQLSSVKLFDLRLGEVVRDMVEREHRASDKSSLHHTGPLNRTEGNPLDRHK